MVLFLRCSGVTENQVLIEFMHICLKENVQFFLLFPRYTVHVNIATDKAALVALLYRALAPISLIEDSSNCQTGQPVLLPCDYCGQPYSSADLLLPDALQGDQFSPCHLLSSPPCVPTIPSSATDSSSAGATKSTQGVCFRMENVGPVNMLLAFPFLNEHSV